MACDAQSLQEAAEHVEARGLYGAASLIRRCAMWDTWGNESLGHVEMVS